MSFIKRVKNQNREKNHQGTLKLPFYKKKTWKVIFIFLAVIFIGLAAFVSYLYATGSKVFDNSNSGSIVKALKNGGDKLLGQDEGRVNIVFMGRGGENHPGGLLTDSIMVISIDTKDKKMAMISVPRDLQVSIKNHGQSKVNEAFADGYNDYLAKDCKKKNKNDCKDSASSAGAELTKSTLSDVLGIPIHYYATIDFEGFKEFIDAIGGIDLYVDKTIYDPYYPDKNMKGYEPFSIKAGQHHLTGEIALKYARSRETTSDFDRSRRQQQIISAVREKTLRLGILANPKKIIEIVNIVADHTRTSLSPSEVRTLVEMFKDIDQDKTISKVLSSGSGNYLISDSSTGIYYLRPRTGNFEEIRRMVKNIFNETSADNSEVKVEVLNGSSTSGQGSKAAGLLEDAGYQVVLVQNAPEKTKKTILYDYTNGAKAATVKYFQDKFKAEVVTKKDSTKKADFSLVIGDNYVVSKN